MKYYLLLLFTLTILGLNAQTFDAGIRIQKTSEMYWENGISAKYSFKEFAPERFYIGFDYITSRLGSAFGSNAIKQDNYILSGMWYFKDPKAFRCYGKVNAGYFYSDYEEAIFDEIPNTTFFASPELGFTYKNKNVPLYFNLGLGYSFGFAKTGYLPGTFQPAYAHLDIQFPIFKSTSHE